MKKSTGISTLLVLVYQNFMGSQKSIKLEYH